MSNLNSPFLTEYGKVITPIVYLTAFNPYRGLPVTDFFIYPPIHNAFFAS